MEDHGRCRAPRPRRGAGTVPPRRRRRGRPGTVSGGAVRAGGHRHDARSAGGGGRLRPRGGCRVPPCPLPAGTAPPGRRRRSGRLVRCGVRPVRCLRRADRLSPARHRHQRPAGAGDSRASGRAAPDPRAWQGAPGGIHAQDAGGQAGQTAVRLRRYPPGGCTCHARTACGGRRGTAAPDPGLHGAKPPPASPTASGWMPHCPPA